MDTVNENDWKLFRSRLPGWQEAYMEKLIEEYIGILNGDEPASHKFWRVEERTRQDKREPGVIITEMSRSKMRLNLLRLLDHSVITLNDLEGFSEELREDLCHVAKIWASESDTE